MAVVAVLIFKFTKYNYRAQGEFKGAMLSSDTPIEKWGFATEVTIKPVLEVEYACSGLLKFANGVLYDEEGNRVFCKCNAPAIAFMATLETFVGFCLKCDPTINQVDI